MFEISFAPVETALARTYNIAPDDMGRFRGRLTFLQKGGLFGAGHQPGKGNRLTYQPDQFNRWIFCLELAEFGVPPAVQLKLVAEFWEPRIRAIFAEAAKTLVRPPSDGDIALLMVGVSQMAGSWSGAVPNINSCPLRKLAARMALGMQAREDDPLPPRALVVNLSARLRRFHNALADAHDLREPVPMRLQPAAKGRAKYK